MKLLVYHVSEHRDDNLVRPLWTRIFDEGEEHFTLHRVPAWCSFRCFPFENAALEGVDPSEAADRLVAKVIPLGQRFYPSECAFPLRKCFHLL